MRTEFGQPRTSCSCEVCVGNCRVMPGYLIPADLERMIPVGEEPLAWAERNLFASPGALVMVASTGRTFRIRTLVPAIKPDGSCINLTEGGSCAIHEVSPFGCAFFDCGPETQERSQLARQGLLAVYDATITNQDSLYYKIWSHLANHGFAQKAPDVLRRKFAEAEK